jgi:ribosome maturation factor RimP
MKTTELSHLLEPVVARLQLELDRVEVLPAGRRHVVRIFLDGDGPAGRGPSLDDIADATRAISDALDASTVTGNGPYTLEVSSRGVGRPLSEAKHYRRNTGRLVHVSGPDLDLTGRIVAVADDAVVLDVDGAERSVALAGVTQAVVQVELNRPLDDADAAEDETDTDDTDEEE